MNKFQIEQKLQHRLDFDGMFDLACGTADKKIKCTDIIDLCNYQNQQIAFRASWVLEFAFGLNNQIFLRQLPAFLNLYPKIKNSSVQRNFTKIMIQLTEEKFMGKAKLKPSIFDESLTATFEWLLNSETPVAVQANTLEIIFQLSAYHYWVLEELTVILEQKLISGSPALLSRSKKILRLISLK